MILAGHTAIAGVTPLGLPQTPNLHADGAVQPAIVMFNLALVRHHMLDTLTELIASAGNISFNSPARHTGARIPAGAEAASPRY
jgi:hypothetical protein